MRWLTCRSRCRLPSLDQRSPASTRPMDRTVRRTHRNQDRLYPPGHSCSPDLRGAAVRGANSPTVLEELELEEAAATLGANRLQTLVRVTFPGLVPALLTGLRSPMRARSANT